MRVLKWVYFQLWNVRFRLLYWYAQTKKEEVYYLQSLIFEFFNYKNEVCSGIHMGYINKPGYVHEITNSVCWEAPIIFMAHVGGKPAVGMAIEMHRRHIAIRQLHGVRGVQLPPELREWPKVFVEACMAFAQERGLKEVRLYRADQDMFYRAPYIDESTESADAVRRRMRRRYDGTARQLKFVMKKRWGVWYNPTYPSHT